MSHHLQSASGAQHLQQPAYDPQPCLASISIPSRISPHIQDVLHLHCILDEPLLLASLANGAASGRLKLDGNNL